MSPCILAHCPLPPSRIPHDLTAACKSGALSRTPMHQAERAAGARRKQLGCATSCRRCAPPPSGGFRCPAPQAHEARSGRWHSAASLFDPFLLDGCCERVLGTQSPCSAGWRGIPSPRLHPTLEAAAGRPRRCARLCCCAFRATLGPCRLLLPVWTGLTRWPPGNPLVAVSCDRSARQRTPRARGSIRRGSPQPNRVIGPMLGAVRACISLYCFLIRSCVKQRHSSSSIRS